VYEEGNKRYNDELFLFDGNNGAILLENGGGKTVFIQTALQAILPHTTLAERKIKDTLLLDQAPAHIAIEWILNDNPRRYVTTSVSLFLTKNGLDSLRYVYEYTGIDPYQLEEIPFVKDSEGKKRPADKGEIQDYYAAMRDRSIHARTFDTIKEYRAFIEEQYHIIASEWESIVKINSSEGGVESFFDDCKTTSSLFDKLLIPTVESSIMGHNPNLFADIFEKQRDGFFLYKKLKESIEENKRIQLELDAYVKTYEQLHLVEKQYVKAKERAKGTGRMIAEQKRVIKVEEDEVRKQKEALNQRKRTYQVKKASFEMAKEEETYRQLHSDYREQLSSLEEHQQEFATFQKSYYSLRLAKLKQEQKEHQEMLHLIEKELAEFDQSEELLDYEDNLTEAKRELLGYFLEEIEKLQKEQQGITFELQPIVEQLVHFQEELSSIKKQKTEASEELAGIRSTIVTRETDLRRLEQQLLANPAQEDVVTEQGKWAERAQQIDEEIIELGQEEKQSFRLIEESETRSDTLRQELQEVTKKRDHILYTQKHLQESQEHVLNRLVELRPQWAAIESVYVKLPTIEARLQEDISRAKVERDDLLNQERLAYRFVDDYHNQDVFFADPYIKEHMKAWQNQVDFITTGVEFLQSLPEEERKLKEGSYLWPLTLITTAKSKNWLLEKIEAIRKSLHFPISIVTLDEASSINRDSNTAWISPIHWQGNLDSAIFEEWKHSIAARAAEVKKMREEKENQIKFREDVWKVLQQFLADYPAEVEKQLREDAYRVANELEVVKRSLDKEKQFVIDHREKMAMIQSKVRNLSSEMQGLNNKLEKAQQYIHYQKELANQKEKLNTLQTTIDNYLKTISQLERQIDRFQEEKGELEARQTELTQRIRYIKADEEYKELQGLTPLYTSQGKKVLINRIREWEYKIREISTTRGEWEAKRQSEKDLLERIGQDQVQLYQEYENIDEQLVFPADGENMLQLTWKKMKELDAVVSNLQQVVARMKSTVDKQQGVLDNMHGKFREMYPDDEPISFSEPLSQIEDMLRSEEQSLQERERYLGQELNRVQHELYSIEEAERELERFVEGHHFNAPDVQAEDISVDDEREFTYSRKSFVQNVTNALKNRLDYVLGESQKVERAKRRFREFCDEHISDVKMKKMAISGIDYKQTYEDIVGFKQNMMTTVERATQYANEHIYQQENELQTFIHQIHQHLRNVVEELKQIPKKTRVKVEDDWKQIFSITIPEWQDEEGKTRIRDHIEWILSQLESSRFLNEKGEEDAGKVRKEVEMWLQSKQLMQIVMSNEVMKVSCRKVTNDNKVTTRSYTWEQSNVWSGGEKWSKNMTLFLGILNYVAEKKQHIQTDMKRHRAVILDNPFGKASSEHILSPVFFIAEQLGFQMIALTAHAEGKFLQDYFPIIYSCRLRPSKDSNKKIISKEKWLYRAYFQDHEPKSMERLGENAQMSLF
jgi:hypothetical protein